MNGVKVVSKTEIMQAVFEGRAHESFEHSDQGVFDVTLMRAWVKQHLFPVFIDVSDCAPFIRESRVTDPARVRELSMKECVEDPVLFVEMIRPDGITHLMIDGHHRMLRLEQEGIPLASAYIVPEQDIIRPSLLMMRNDKVDWGDDIIDGVITKRS